MDDGGHLGVELKYLVNHIFLPLCLPQADDHKVERDLAMCDLVIDRATAFRRRFSAGQHGPWTQILKMMQTLRSLQSTAQLEQVLLMFSMKNMTVGDILVVPIRAQNACLILRSEQQQAIFEFFEVDPPNAQVMGAVGRLIRVFPGHAISIPNETAKDPLFQRELASFLAHMDRDALSDSTASTTKAQSTVTEVRDTSDPHYITRLLTGILLGLKDSHSADTERIQKNTRNDILWKNAYKPWRRSPLWLIIRVALQTTLQRICGSLGRSSFKAFMIFVMATIPSLKDCNALCNDNLHCMRAKIARRLRKLGDVAPKFVQDEALIGIEAINDLLKTRWQDLQSSHCRSLSWSPKALDIQGDTNLSLLQSREYIQGRISQTEIVVTPDTTFKPEEPVRLRDTLQRGFNSSSVAAALERDHVISLMDLEYFVSASLDDWVDNHLLSESACKTVVECINFYVQTAGNLYKGPEQRSIQLLTVFQMWVAIDRMATAQIPALLDYSPEIPLQLLDALMLRDSHLIQQLRYVRLHLSSRHSQATHGSVFKDEITPSSFAVNYFDSSTELRDLKHRIETDAEAKRGKKRAELQEKTKLYRSLLRQSKSEDHTYTFNMHGKKKHKNSCPKCRLEVEASNMSIAVHEWPLPQSERLAKAMVFELQCPAPFRMWRDTTYMILYDLCRPPGAQVEKDEPRILLEKYTEIHAYLGDISRVTYASSTKTFLRSHYASQQVSDATEDSICVNNGLQFHLFDTHHVRWLKNSFVDLSLSKCCTFVLPPGGSYSSLQDALDVTGQTSNLAISQQAKAPPEMNLHEYLAFRTLRSGEKLQWMNIARELRTGVLSFSRIEVQMLIFQSVMQTGPFLDSDSPPEWHNLLISPQFGMRLLVEIDNFLSNIEGNWLNIMALQTVTLLVTQLLNFAKGESIISQACAILRRGRGIAFTWVKTLIDLISNTEDDTAIAQLRTRLCSAALACRATYDVTLTLIHRLLDSDLDVYLLISCSILIHDNSQPIGSSSSDMDSSKLARNTRLSYHICLLDSVKHHQKGLDDAILDIWPHFSPSQGWKKLRYPNDRWIMTSSLSTQDPNGKQSTVHLNLFDGTLLINGKPLQRLPASILQHPTYLRVLGSKVLDIVPSDVSHMDFATRKPISGFYLYFKLEPSGNLIVRTKRQQVIHELIPHDTFSQDLPAHFVNAYTHWLQVSPSSNEHLCKIEFRLLDNTWSTSPNNWYLTLSRKVSTLRQANKLLIDIRSETFEKTAILLQSLEEFEHIHITTEAAQGSNKLLVSLPRFKLIFFLNSFDELESKNYRDMVLDLDSQSIGTMVGLTSQLVLRQKSPDLDPSRLRSVIIPFGDIETEKDPKTHQMTRVFVKLDARSSRLRYFKYDIDSDLGQLVGATLLAHFYRVYLHAATSHVLPDHLTGKTGMEEALGALRSARSRSFQALDDDELHLLCNIAKVPAQRSWYPPHRKAMQSVDWGKFAPLGQHRDYYTIIQTILQHHDALLIFKSVAEAQPSATLLQSDDSKDDSHLHDRCISRHYNLYPSQLICHVPVAGDDIVYSGSNRKSGSPQDHLKAVQVASDVSALVQSWPRQVPAAPDLWYMIESFGTLSLPDLNAFNLSYSNKYLTCRPQNVWLALYEKCRRNQVSTAIRYQLMFTFPALTYQSPLFLDLVPIFLAFATIPQFAGIIPPSFDHFDLSFGVSPDREPLQKIFMDNAIPFKKSPSYDLDRYDGENESAYLTRCKLHYSAECSSQAKEYVEKIILQWPRGELSWSALPHLQPKFIELSLKLKRDVNLLFQAWHKNWLLKAHIQEVQVVLNKAFSGQTRAIPQSKIIEERMFQVPVSAPAFPTRQPVRGLADLLMRFPPPISHPPAMPTYYSQDIQDAPADVHAQSGELECLFRKFKYEKHAVFRRRYGRALEDSLERHIERQTEDISNSFVRDSNHLPSLAMLWSYREDCDQHLSRMLKSIESILFPSFGDSIQCAEHLSGLWPTITLASLVGLLSETSAISLPKDWKSTIMSLARAVMKHQQAQRLVRFHMSEAYEDFWKEFYNIIPDSERHAEWLLIQIEGDFLLRPLQREVAREMMFPSSDDNTLLQLNMGEGKSSVILPVVASALADQTKLVRVVVLKPLARQMFGLLVRRLTGLANRQIFYLPFSRDVKVQEASVQLQKLFELCRQERGILVAQPEHILSFKLMNISLLINDASPALFRSQQWLANCSRDILDESDEILSAKYQLIYTSGTQEPLDDHPDRWLKIQSILHCARRHARSVLENYPDGFSIEESKGAVFPVTRVLSGQAAAALARYIAEDMLNQEQFRLLPEGARQVALQFIISPLDRELETAVLHKFKGTMLWKSLLLLRGFIGGGILRFVLEKKRWRVDYGLDLTRTLLAVPYRAKDVPTPRADFGHPDVAIALTCLSYYYGGLRDTELITCFQLLLKLDNPTMEYQTWVNASDDVPDRLQDVLGINMEDQVQWETHLKPLFQRNYAVIDFYLSKVVFPKEAKQFPRRLAASSWDLAEKKLHVMTGFSGTNDNRYLLPTSIQQQDPLDQLGTNAMVLGYLLQPENNNYVCLGQDKPISSRGILERIVNNHPPIHVLLDVGALMLDMQSDEIASTWLSIAPNLEAIVFFDDRDELVVMSQDQTLEPLEVSQYSQKLDVCGIYLDDAHTRGTDLKLPKDFKAAVTLGPRLTKDRLVQGCMRMRKLGHGQSLIFLAPPEVDRAIRALADPHMDVVRTSDIVRWVLNETCEHIQYHLAHWADQGAEYKKRHEAWTAYESMPFNHETAERLQASWEEQDARSLEEMYGVKSARTRIHPAFEIRELRERLDEYGVSSLGNSEMDEEQEREVSHEMERERQVQRPPEIAPALHQVHGDVRRLITQGDLAANSPAFVPLFSSLRHLGNHAWSSNLLATKDFARTIAGSPSSATDYQRPVEWVVSYQKKGQGRVLIAFSSFEVNELLPCILNSKFVHLHMYAPRVTQGMQSFEDLRFFCVPPLPETWTPPSATDICQLNLFAGQLYLESYDEYMRLRKVLGLVGDETKGEPNQWWESDGFVKPENRRGAMKYNCKFTSSPLPFLKDLVGLRRKGMAYHSTHIGRILHGGVLKQDDFDSKDCKPKLESI